MNELAAIEHTLDPFPVYQKLRRSSPVYFNPDRQDWNVFRYEDVHRVLSDHEIFSSQFTRRRPGAAMGASMIASDPPRHRQLRSLVSQAFTPHAVEALAPRITQIVQEQMEQVIGTGQMDVIRDLAYPLPVIVIAELLGIPVTDRERFKHWSDLMVQGVGRLGEPRPENYRNPDIQEMMTYFINMIEKRREEPKDDLISGLVQANIDGQKLDLPDLLGFCALLLVAGNETTTNLIGNAMLTFSEHPGAWQQLRAEPDLLPQAIEEVLRFRSPVQTMFRVATEDIHIGGQDIPAGSPVMAWIGSANHDESQFSQPERFELQRSPNRHLAFGQGIHYCLGAPLARLEAKIALGELLERIESFSLNPDAVLDRMPSLLIYGVRSLPITFTQVKDRQAV